MKRFAAFVLVLAIAGCSDFPSFGDPDPGFGDWAAYPRLVPIEGLIIKAIGPGSAAPGVARPLNDLADPVAARVAALKRRAAILRGAPVDDTTRSRISRQ